jgi:hypothetical protein
VLLYWSVVPRRGGYGVDTSPKVVVESSRAAAGDDDHRSRSRGQRPRKMAPAVAYTPSTWQGLTVNLPAKITCDRSMQQTQAIHPPAARLGTPRMRPALRFQGRSRTRSRNWNTSP